MSTAKSAPSSRGLSKILRDFGGDLLLGSIAAFYVIMVPYTKVEESFNIQLEACKKFRPIYHKEE